MVALQYIDISRPAMEALWSVSTVTIVFLIYHYTTNHNKESNKSINKLIPNVSLILRQRLTGVILFGILPFFITLFMFRLPLQGYGLNFLKLNDSLIWILILSPIVILINYLNAFKTSNLAMYPQIRHKTWTLYLITISALSWISYLLAYEFMFRGFLLFTFYHSFGPELAIAVNTSIYALVHLPKGRKETLGAIPLGIILCILTLMTGNIWIAVIIHIIMALSNEWFSIKAHPHMKIIRR